MNITTPAGKDERLWQIASKRASFKKHFITYLIINIFLWAFWYFNGDNTGFNLQKGNIPWPLFTTLGWGLGVAFHFAGAYLFHDNNSVENEYQKLSNNQNK